MSPYATGAGGVTLERRVAVLYLVRLLTGTTAKELHGRRVERVAFQQAPAHRVDDLVVSGVSDDGKAPLELWVAVRRAPAFVRSDEDTRKLVGDLVADLRGSRSNGTETRLAICVAGERAAAQQVSTLAEHARTQPTAAKFFQLIRTPDKFARGLAHRLDHLEALGAANLPAPGGAPEVTWQLLRVLDVLIPRVETPDESDWADLLNWLERFGREPTIAAAMALRDRLESLAARYTPVAADVDLHMLCRDTRDVLGPDPLSIRSGPDTALDTGRAERVALLAQQLRDRDPELALAVAAAAVRDLPPSPTSTLTLTLWGLTTTPQVQRLSVGHVAGITDLIRLPEPGRVRTIDGRGTVCTWTMPGSLVHECRLPAQEFRRDALLSVDGRHALIVEDGDHFAVWRLDDQVRVSRRHSPFVFGLTTFSWGAASHLAGETHPGKLQVTRVGSDGVAVVATLDVDVLRTAWSPDGRLLAVATGDGIRVFTVGQTVEPLRTLPLKADAATLAWSPDGRWLGVLTPSRSTATTILTDKRTLRIFDMTSGACPVLWKLTVADAFTWSPDSSTVAYVATKPSGASTLALREVATGGKRQRRLPLPLPVEGLWWPTDRAVVMATPAEGLYK